MFDRKLKAATAYEFPKISIDFNVYIKDEDAVDVTSILEYKRKNTDNLLQLFGIDLQLNQVKLDSVVLKSNQYSITIDPKDKSQILNIPNAKEHGVVEISNAVYPKDGLYDQNGIVIAYCEQSRTLRFAFSPALNNLASYQTNVFCNDYLPVVGIGNEVDATNCHYEYIDQCNKFSTAFIMAVGANLDRSSGGDYNVVTNVYCDKSLFSYAEAKFISAVVDKAVEFRVEPLGKYPFAARFFSRSKSVKDSPLMLQINLPMFGIFNYYFAYCSI
jgi:hypothetical protein